MFPASHIPFIATFDFFLFLFFLFVYYFNISSPDLSLFQKKYLFVECYPIFLYISMLLFDGAVSLSIFEGFFCNHLGFNTLIIILSPAY